jgi:hypothetical protein
MYVLEKLVTMRQVTQFLAGAEQTLLACPLFAIGCDRSFA